MSYKTACAVTLLVVAATSSSAQGFSGGQLGIEYNTLLDGSDFDGTAYTLGAEYAFTRNFATALDVTSYNLNGLGSESSITLHGIYHLNDAASVGVFAGRDAGSATLFGFEGGTEFSGGVIGGYIGIVEGTSDDATIFGADGSYAFNEKISIVGDLDIAAIDSDTVTNIAIGAEYQMRNGPEFYGQIGNLNADSSGVSGNATYIGIGARVNFGAARGTTFDQRSLFEALPGF